MNEILERLKNLNLQIENVYPVKGGDLNDCFRIESFTHKYFLKLNTAQNFPNLFLKEVRGLQAIAETNLFNNPKIISVGETDNDFQYLILEWIEKGEANFTNWSEFGERLAKLHQNTNDTFGWEEDNYIGIILQPNQYKSSWKDFYANSRILPMIKLLADKKILKNKDIKAAEKICLEIDNFFPNEKPALLHGDLWNGNIIPRSNGEITLIDPATYYGHREMDLAMADLFGGFDDAFFDTYNEIFPIENDFEERKQIAQLFPLLVHALLYEGYYIDDVQAILKKFQFKLP